MGSTRAVRTPPIGSRVGNLLWLGWVDLVICLSRCLLMVGMPEKYLLVGLLIGLRHVTVVWFFDCLRRLVIKMTLTLSHRHRTLRRVGGIDPGCRNTAN